MPNLYDLFDLLVFLVHNFTLHHGIYHGVLDRNTPHWRYFPFWLFAQVTHTSITLIFAFLYGFGSFIVSIPFEIKEAYDFWPGLTFEEFLIDLRGTLRHFAQVGWDHLIDAVDANANTDVNRKNEFTQERAALVVARVLAPVRYWAVRPILWAAIVYEAMIQLVIYGTWLAWSLLGGT